MGDTCERTVRERGQTGVIAVALLVGITVAGMTVVTVLGAGALSDAESAVSSDAAEHAVMEFDSRTSLVAHGGAESKQARLVTSHSGPVTVDSEAGWLNVTIVNETTEAVEEPVTNATLGAVVYADDGKRIAYQGGGVWRQGNGGSTVLSAPELHYRGTTLTLPLVTVTGDSSVSGRVRITQARPAVAHFPNESTDRMNPLREGKVRLEVHSAYYRAWGAFFEQRFGGTVSYDHDRERASIVLEVPTAHERTVDSAVSSSAVSGTLSLSGSGSFPAFTDSYNSSKGNYTETNASDGTLVTAGDVDVSGNARVEGDVRAGGATSLSGTAVVNGSVFWTSGFSASGSAEYDGENQISGVDTDSTVGTRVSRKVDELAGDNSNDQTTAITNELLSFGGNTLTLAHEGTGEYYLESVDLRGKDLTIDTEGKDVLIGVEEEFHIEKGTNITVRGDGRVRFYVKDDIDIEDDSELYVPADRSQRLWVYGTENSEITIEGSASNDPRVVGVIYAPSGAGEADATVQHAAVYGGIVAGEIEVGTGGAIHYDKALETADPFPTNNEVPRVTYLHVSTTRINVTNA